MSAAVATFGASSPVSSWKIDLSRGPDWLFARLSPPEAHADDGRLAEHLWDLLEQHFTYRVVLELNDVRRLNSPLVGQLVKLRKWVRRRGGTIRLCGLSRGNQQVLDTHRLGDRLPAFPDRMCAVRGYQPAKKPK